MNLPNTNIEVKNENYFITFEANGTGRKTVLTNNFKKTLNKWHSAGYKMFGSPVKYVECYRAFAKCRKNGQVSTRNKKTLLLANAMYHINAAIEKGQLTID